MSFEFPEASELTNVGHLAFRLNVPVGACPKPANTAYTTLLWLRTPREYLANFSYQFLFRGDGRNSGNAGRFAITNASGVLTLGGIIVNTTGGAVSANPGTITLQPNKTYLVMVIANAANVHLIACEPGGTPLRATVADTALFTTALNGDAWSSIGGGNHSTLRAHPGPMEEFCMWTGAFPETGGVPDETLIAAIASGAQDLAAMPAPLTPVFRYRLQNQTDLADASVAAKGNLTASNEDASVGKDGFTAGPMRPVSLMPRVQADQISQAIFGTPGDIATAFATVRTPSGTYSGITPTAIQARLLDRTGAVVKDWTVVDAAPSGGTFAAGNLTGIPMTAGFLRCEIRAMNGGAVVAGPVPVWGRRGAGFSIQSSAQSQLQQLFLNNSASVAMPANTYAVVHRQEGFDAGVLRSFVMSATLAQTRGATLGIRQAIIEINAKFPQIPVQIATVCQEGTAITEYYGAGLHALRWAGTKAQMGFQPGEAPAPFFMVFMGHTSGAGAGYQAQLEALVAFSAAEYGTPIRYLHVPVPRYKGAGATDSGNALSQIQSRTGAYALCRAQPSMHHYMGSWSSVASGSDNDPPTSNAHPEPSARGMGRSGGMIGWAMLSAARAVPDVPVGITQAEIVGSTAVLRFGPINP